MCMTISATENGTWKGTLEARVEKLLNLGDGGCLISRKFRERHKSMTLYGSLDLRKRVKIAP